MRRIGVGIDQAVAGIGAAIPRLRGGKFPCVVRGGGAGRAEVRVRGGGPGGGGDGGEGTRDGRRAGPRRRPPGRAAGGPGVPRAEDHHRHG